MNAGGSGLANVIAIYLSDSWFPVWAIFKAYFRDVEEIHKDIDGTIIVIVYMYYKWHR